MYRTQGFILSVEKTGEADGALSLFTKDFGKQKCIAQGVRKSDSKLRTILQAGNLIDFVFVPLRSGRYRVTSPSLSESFYQIRSSQKKLALFLFSLAIIDTVLFEGEKDEALWECMYTWCTELAIYQKMTDEDISAARFWFLARLFHVLGFMSEKSALSVPASLVEWLHDHPAIFNEKGLVSAYAASLNFSLPGHFLLQ